MTEDPISIHVLTCTHREQGYDYDRMIGYVFLFENRININFLNNIDKI